MARVRKEAKTYGSRPAPIIVPTSCFPPSGHPHLGIGPVHPYAPPYGCEMDAYDLAATTFATVSAITA